MNLESYIELVDEVRDEDGNVGCVYKIITGTETELKFENRSWSDAKDEFEQLLDAMDYYANIKYWENK